MKKLRLYLHALLPILLLALPGARLAGADGIQHTNIVEAAYSLQAPPDLGKIAPITSLKVHGGILYAAGCDGLAALDAEGRLLWVLPLPTAGVRLVDADDEGVAFTAFDPTGVERGAIKSAIWGHLLDKPTFGNATVGLVSAKGGLLWTAESSEQSQLSPPALGRTSLAVVRAKSWCVLSRKDGKELGRDSIFPSLGGLNESQAGQIGCVKPLFLDGFYYMSHLNFLKQVDETGIEKESSRSFGLTSPFENITAGPVLFDGKLVFGNGPMDKEARPLLFAATPSLKDAWKTRLDDLKSFFTRLDTVNRSVTAPADIVPAKDALYVATNFIVYRFDAKGDKVWGVINEKGGLYPGSRRGVRFPAAPKVLGIAITDYRWCFRKAPGAQLVATDGQVFVVTQHAKKDALTVLDAKTGAYVRSITFPQDQIAEMVLFGDHLALATSDGLKFIKAS